MAVMAFGLQWLRKVFGQEWWIWALAYFLCTSFFFVQLFKLLPNYFAPTMTYTEVENVQLKDIDFPIDFEICLKPLLSSTALQQFGYLSPFHYTVGANPDNTLIGWGGHHSNNSGAITSAKEVLKAARTNVTTNSLSNIHISTYGGNATENLVDMVSLDKINWLYECFSLNLSNIQKPDLNGMEGIAVNFNQSDGNFLKNNFSVELQVQGKTLASQRVIQEHQLYASGDAMKLSSDDVKLNLFSTYIVKIKKNVFVEEDRTKNCQNYPNEDFVSYKECDFQYMKNRVKELTPKLYLIPPWLTDDLDHVTSEPVTFSSHVAYQLGRLITGLATSDCPLPCTRVAGVGRTHSPKGHVLLRKKESPTYATTTKCETLIVVPPFLNRLGRMCNKSNPAFGYPSTKVSLLSEGFQQKSSCFWRAFREPIDYEIWRSFNDSEPAFRELSGSF